MKGFDMIAIIMYLVMLVIGILIGAVATIFYMKRMWEKVAKEVRAEQDEARKTRYDQFFN
jgi:hypothetical protein